MWQWMREKFKGGRKGRRKGGKRRGPGPTWDPQATLRGLRRLGAAALVLGIAAAAVWSEGQLLTYARQRPLPPTSPQQITLVNTPAWMSPLTSQELQTRAAWALEGDPLSPYALENVAFALEQTAWVRQVLRIERDAGSGARIFAQYRRPAALVEHAGEYHLTALDGVRLPGIYLPHQIPAVGLPTVVDARAPLPHEGQPWADDVIAALDLIRLLEPQPYFEQVRSVSVRDEAGRIRPALLTGRPGAAVFWGRPVGQEQPIEVAVDVKLRNLEAVYRQRGSIDAGGRRVHIYGPAIFVERQGLTAADDSVRGVSYTW
jgi:hypothetical protein